MAENPTYNPLLEFNNLVRDAYDAQEAFDNWDRGKTWTSSVFSREPRECTLAEVVSEWAKANVALIEYVIAHAEPLLEEERKEATE